MAPNRIPEWFPKLWDLWDIRFSIQFSLLIQAILIFMAPLRKRMPQKWVTISIWFAYLLADAVAIFCVGLISNSQGKGDDPCSKPLSEAKTEILHAFWAPFLLLHLGGPDTITAFALEDNELWIRHLLSLLIQLVAVTYVILLSLPENQIWGPTCLILVVGLVKYAERSYALYLASLKSFRESLLALTKPDPGPNYARLMYEFAWMKENEVAAKIVTVKKPETNQEINTSIEEGSNRRDDDPDDDVVLVEKAYEFFNKFKGLIVDLIYNFQDRDDSRRFFLEINQVEKAYRVIEIELSFIYDVLYTKASILHCWKGYFLRLMASTSIVAAFFLFGFSNKDKMHHIDVAVTYALLTGAISLEVIAFLNLVFSDWTIALLKNWDSSSSKFSESAKSLIYSIVTRNIFFRKSRWSESISQFSLLNFCLCKRRKWVENAVECLRLKDFLDGSQYKNRTPLSPKLQEFIFRELKSKSRKATDLPTTKEMCSSRGMYILNDYVDHAYADHADADHANQVKETFRWRFQVEYDASLLMWHIATDILYHDEAPTDCDDSKTDSDDSTTDSDRKLCKNLSDYMLYLLVIHPTAITTISSIAQTRYKDTCAEAEKFFGEQQRSVEPETNKSKSVLKLFGEYRLKAKKKELKKACQSLLHVDTLVKPSEVKGDQSKSVFFDGVMLAKDLQKFIPDKWKMMSQVWVELLCYSASHSRATNHAQHVSRGGELVTLVWLLMVNFGLAEQFSILAVHGEAKFVMRK